MALDISYIRSLISEHKITDAFDQMATHLPEHFLKDLTLLQSRYTKNETDHLVSGISSPEAYQRSLNQIIQGMLQLLDNAEYPTSVGLFAAVADEPESIQKDKVSIELKEEGHNKKVYVISYKKNAYELRIHSGFSKILIYFNGDEVRRISNFFTYRLETEFFVLMGNEKFEVRVYIEFTYLLAHIKTLNLYLNDQILTLD